MEIAILILCLISLAISAYCAFTAKAALKKLDEGNNGKENETLSHDMRELKNTVFDEFSRNRTERSNTDKNNRDDLLNSFSEMYNRIDKLTSANIQNLKVLSDNMDSRLRELRGSIEAQSDRQNEKMTDSLEKIRVSNEKKLDEMRQVVDEKLTNTLTQRLDSSFKTVSEQLEHLYSALGEMKVMSSGITDNVSALNRVLTNVKARGTWAEVQLKNILDQTIPTMYVENFAADEKTRERVEFAVKIPSSDGSGSMTYLPIDSKFPIEDYIRLCDASERGDAEALARARKDLEDRVLREAKEITKYIKAPKTTPFAIMYLASEGLYAEIASSESGLPEKLHSNYNIMIAGPTTVTALLNSLAMGFKVAAINEKANEVRLILAAVKSQYDKFGTLLIKAKKKIDEAGKSLEDAQHRNDMIYKKLRSVEAINTGDSDGILEISAEEFDDE